MFSFTLESTKGKARRGVMHTPHGDVQTPIFMPVGTQATVKALSPEDLTATKAQIILGNTYHLHLRPGEENIKNLGGIQKFMNWNKPMLTDSGGFQVFSLGAQIDQKNADAADSDSTKKSPEQKFSKITEDGVEFSSHLDGSKHFFSPEKAIEIQRNLGADIIMAFDECTADDAPKNYAQEALTRTIAWAKRCKDTWEQHDRKSVLGEYQALFGIVQGAAHKDLRQKAAREIVALGFDGVAVGGETIGYNMEKTVEVMGWIEDLLPADKPRYAMGLGRDPQDVIDAVRAGFDMFDCVAPTRLARNGALYHGNVIGTGPENWAFKSEFPKGRLQIGNTQYALDQKPIQEGCDCYTCSQGFTRAYLRHLYQSKELLYYRLASIHNVRFMLRLTEFLRSTI
ncbi:MAG TPA: tRNA guanosine(34) transglycosylase Tgt [Candidatus Saccharimonadia bacterium]|nr:tRNA guanosine(34) transglycosylase Tgt [Candidatus Saccharimonadia bacterium]